MDADRFPDCLVFTLSAEGGYSNNPHDPGHQTQSGVTLATFRHWRHDPTATVAQLKAITAPELSALYAGLYWAPPCCGNLPRGADLMTFEMSVNAGPRTSAMILQHVLRVEADGRIGPLTLAAAAAVEPDVLVNKLAIAQEAYYRSLPGFATFGRGWMNRLAARVAAAKDIIKSPTRAC